MKAVVILVGIICLMLTIAIMAVQPPSTKGQIPEEQIKAEKQAQADKLGVVADMVDAALTRMNYKGDRTQYDRGGITKSDMNRLQKLVNQYKDIPLYKQLKKELDPEAFPLLFLLTTTERITNLYSPSLGHSCKKECLDQIRFHFDQLGVDVKTVEPNTGPRDILIGAIVGFSAIAIFMYWLFRQFSLLSRLKERLDKEKNST